MSTRLTIEAGRRRLALLLAACGVLMCSLASGATGSASAAVDYCQFADTPVTQLSADRANRAVHCLTNRARVANGVPPLALNYYLVRPAQAHAQKSVQLRWWDPGNGATSHVDPQTGSTPADRIKAGGYCPNGTAQTNENTFSSSGWWQYPATPAGAVNWWLSDPPHRATLLNPLYRGEGVGVAVGLAFPGTQWDPAGTFVVDFGRCD